jgi:hypothetical protein
MLAFIFEEYGVILEYLLEKKQKNMPIVTDALSRLNTDNLEIQE